MKNRIAETIIDIPADDRAAINAAARAAVAWGIENAPARQLSRAEFREYFGISVNAMSGKLDGVPAVGSSQAESAGCQALAADPDKICSHCYAAALLALRAGLAKNLQRNGRILRAAEIPAMYWPDLLVNMARVESFSDCQSVTMATNYCHLADAQTGRVGVWTKFPGWYDAAFKLRGGKPANMSIGISSAYLNQQAAALPAWADFVFTVYDLQTAAADRVAITCGGRKCRECRVCYNADHTRGGVTVVNELLKSQQLSARAHVRRVYKQVLVLQARRDRLAAAEMAADRKESKRCARLVKNSAEKLQRMASDEITAACLRMAAAGVIKLDTYVDLQTIFNETGKRVIA